ncbi:MAG: 30S ribosomal protein S21 [Candidatus Phytoplasma cynodontis]|uniref:30S ribosomal protein S21 n=1 Tax='Cynodon dactylon' phytoplasma TaxID=295320 RepID=UPI001265BA91|nr:30S ribosomal protein S21 ['Cynodon dactylon' phytoplasma]KAB8121879.1 30S ribosomal protein S21 ['Cynodon dactylon' phytoplasma]WIA07794.1 MAG: 30S ribosomal protein S21 [Candidatus Phytoplasma cynodontis]
MTKTVVKKDENFEDTLRRFRRDTSKSGILAQARKKEFYVKPSTERKNRRKSLNMKKKKKINFSK